jgi:protein AATF/BFR2
LVQNLNKWSAKVQAVAPNVLLPSTRGSFARNSKSFTNNLKSAVQLIEETIEGGKAVPRTRISRTGKAITRIGTKPAEGPDGDAEMNENGVATSESPEIFDDADFYQQLLRDVIDRRAGKDGAQGDPWSVRPKKVKRKVDSRLSKGRKLKYVFESSNYPAVLTRDFFF